MEYWLLIPGFTVGCIFGFAAGYWFQQAEVERAERDCQCRQIELRELRDEINRTTKNTALMRKWAKGAR
jgi:hypothetical protein